MSHRSCDDIVKQVGQNKLDEYLFDSFDLEDSVELTLCLLARGANPDAEINGFTALEANWLGFDVFARKEALRINEECLKVAELLISHGAKQGLMTAIMFEDETSAVTLQKAGG